MNIRVTLGPCHSTQSRDLDFTRRSLNHETIKLSKHHSPTVERKQTQTHCSHSRTFARTERHHSSQSQKWEAHCTVQSMCSQSGNALYNVEPENFILCNPRKKSIQHFNIDFTFPKCSIRQSTPEFHCDSVLLLTLPSHSFEGRPQLPGSRHSRHPREQSLSLRMPLSSPSRMALEHSRR